MLIGNIRKGAKVSSRNGTVYWFAGLYKDIVGYESKYLPPYAFSRSPIKDGGGGPYDLRWGDGSVLPGTVNGGDIIL